MIAFYALLNSSLQSHPIAPLSQHLSQSTYSNAQGSPLPFLTASFGSIIDDQYHCIVNIFISTANCL
jgi:hypothetical protein